MKAIATLLLVGSALALSACGPDPLTRGATGAVTGGAVAGPVGAVAGGIAGASGAVQVR